jgi:hypothetical protein
VSALPPGDESEPTLEGLELDLDALCEAWVVWCRRHRLYWRASAASALLARQGLGTRPLRSEALESISAGSLTAFHIAFITQPDALDRQVFELYYVQRVRPIKAAAAALGIGRAQFYRVLAEFRQRVLVAARALEQDARETGGAARSSISLQLLSSHSG